MPVASQLIGTGSGPDTLGVVVGTWKEIQSEVAAELIAHGPSASGVYARFAGPAAATLQLLNPQGKVARTLGAGAGLVAATADSSSEPTWLITGTDPAGVTAAAAALDRRGPARSLRARRPGRAPALPVAVAGADSELPPPREPAAQRSRRRRLRLLPGARRRRADGVQPAGRWARSRWPCWRPGSAPGVGPRDAAGGAVRAAAGGGDRRRQRAGHPGRADRDRAARRPAGARATPTSRSRRPSTARSWACVRWR